MIDTDTDREVVPPPARDGVGGLENETPRIVSVSDVHGYIDEGRSALLAVGDHTAFDPVVETDDDGRLHWAGNDYVLVFNGDLVDRGPDNEPTLRMAGRLRREAPPGRVRMTVGNHEMALALPEVVHWPQWYSGQVTDDEREGFYDSILDGSVVAAYEGYEYTYAHAGRTESYAASDVNERLVEAAKRLKEAVGTPRDAEVQRSVDAGFSDLFGRGRRSSRGPGGGICWLDFSHMPENAPPQVVGHTRHATVTREGAVVCENVIRSNRRSDGGEAVVVETPNGLLALTRTGDGVERRDLDP